MSEENSYCSPAWYRKRNNIPSNQLDFDNLDEFIERRSKRKSWKYDDKRLHDAIVAGCHVVKEDDLVKSFFDWHEIESITTMINPQGENVTFQAPRRGNYSFARKKKKLMNWIEDGLKGLKLWWPAGGRSVMFYTHILMITLTHKRSGDPREKQEAWQNETDEIRKWRSKVARALGVSIASITVKEGTENGFPASHVLLMLDKPVLVFRHVGQKGKITYRLQNNTVLGKLKRFWPHGFVDVEGVASKSEEPIKYVLKYMTKGLSKNCIDKYRKEGLDGLKKHEITFVKTHSYQKLFRLRPVHISSQFKARLNSSGRLDSNGPQSQHGLWRYSTTEYMSYDKYWSMRQESYLSANPPPPIACKISP